MSFDYSTIGKTTSRIEADTVASTSKNSNSQLDQADFLKLLTTQLQNQDPTSPVDNNQMVTTMSQLSVVDNLTKITTGMDNIVDTISSSSALSASSLVGRNVLVDSKTAYFDGYNSLGFQIDAGEGAADVTVNVVNSSGSVVDSYTIGSLDGEIDFNWEGLANAESGERYAAGNYTLQVTAEQDGKKVNLPVKSYARVSSVILGATPDETKLNLLGYGEVPLSKVDQISY